MSNPCDVCAAGDRRCGSVGPMRAAPSSFAWALVLAALGVNGCGGSFGSFGGDTAGDRGTLGVLFINNTPYRAMLTAGTFDPADANNDASFVQFGSDSTRHVLEGGAFSDIISLTCARAFSVGSEPLIARVQATAAEADIDSTALSPGVGFSSAAIDDPNAGVADQGTAAARTFLLGTDFPCNALLIVRLEVADTGPDPFTFRFSYIPSESTR